MDTPKNIDRAYPMQRSYLNIKQHKKSLIYDCKGAMKIIYSVLLKMNEDGAVQLNNNIYIFFK